MDGSMKDPERNNGQGPSCMLCGAVQFRPFLRQGDFSYLRCERCNLVFLHPQPRRSELVNAYRGAESDPVDPTTDPTGEEAVYFDRFSEALGRIESRIPGRGRILDIGCAWGFFLAVCRARGWEAFGVDPSETQARYARERFGLPVHAGFLSDARFPSAQFDVVTLWHVLEHIPDPLRELHEIRRIMKEGGLLVLSVPTPQSARQYLSDAVPLHLFYFNEQTLTLLLERAGFRVSSVTGRSSTGAAAVLKKMGMRDPRRMIARHYRWLSGPRRLVNALLRMRNVHEEILLHASPR